MSKIFSKSVLFFLSAVFSLYLISCSDSEASVVTVNASVVFSYASETATPDVSLSLYLQTEHEAQRADTIKIEAPDRSLSWNITSPVLIQGNGKQWAGYSVIKPAKGKQLENGWYNVTYTDAAGSETQTGFNISYKKELLNSSLENFKTVSGVTLGESVVLYDKDLNMLYFGSFKSAWKSAEIINREYNRAVYLRRIMHTPNQTLIVLKPLENIKDEKFNQSLEKK